jgi:hypothetical protein
MDLIAFIRKADIFDIEKIEVHLGLAPGDIKNLQDFDTTTQELIIVKLNWFFTTIGFQLNREFLDEL